MTSVISDAGNYRELNEDSVGYFEEENFRMYVIADGMGGCLAGEVASELAVFGLIKHFKNEENRSDIKVSLAKSIKNANDSIYKKSLESDNYKGMGTTITVCVICDNIMYVGHVGDSSCIVIREDMSIEKITKDHSFAQQLLDSGVITENQASNYYNKNIITRAVGTDSDVTVDLLTIPIKDIYRVILCSDGLTNGVNIEEMLEIVEENLGKDKEICEKLVDLSKQNGSKDNISIIIFKGAE